MALFVVTLLSLLPLGRADVLPPEALHHIAHIAFPQDRLAAQILQTQREKFGMPPGVGCSSLLGPNCASKEALSARGTPLETLLAPLVTCLGGEHLDDAQRSKRVIHIERLSFGEHSNSQDAGADSVTLDAIIIAGLGLGPALSEEEKEDASNLMSSIDPSFLAEVADKVAEVAQIDDKERFRHKFLSAFANLMMKDESMEDEEDVYEEVDDFFMHPSKADQESNWEARRKTAKLDRITKRVKDTMAEILPVHRYTEEEEEEEDIYLTPSDD